ncbi:hypothetical protein ACFQH3_00200 [Haladaptatus sp. GCM10025707]|uniref:hypothetical protein n=1 Tax=unclassified Haladaptatus TaxID=2622732 RepID=UPI0023E8EEC0|nr:hypothetical protein [Haladaptatus sp. QDMS2]
MNRRGFILNAGAATSVLALAGCVGSTGDTTSKLTDSPASKQGVQDSSRITTERSNSTPVPDSDGDGVLDTHDDFPNDPTRSKDSDGDGVADKDDDFPHDSTRSKDSDGDGVADEDDAFPHDSTRSKDFDGDGVADKDDDYPLDDDRSKKILRRSDTDTIEEDYWRYYSFSLSRTGRVEYDFTVRQGPAIDVILMDESEYSFFKNGDRSQYYTALSRMDSTYGSVSEKLSAGSYYLVFDNSNNGVASPPTNFDNDLATVEYTIEISQ